MIYQGSDVKINVTVEQTYLNANGVKITTPIDLTAYSGYIIYLYSKETGVLIQKYSANASSGYVTIEPIDLTLGQIQLWLDKSVTTNAPLGMVYGELKTAVDDTDFSDDLYETVCIFSVDTIVKSQTNGVNPPL